MATLFRGIVLGLGLAALASSVPAGEPKPANVHQQLLDLAGRQQEQRRARFAAVKTKADLEALQKSLREKFLQLFYGLPQAKGPPPAKVTGKIEADDHVVEKLVYESFPGYFVSALLYKPRKITTPCPAVLSPCGHSTVGKADPTYQTLHLNLVKRGFVVLTYDPVGQGERSQFWDADKNKSRFNLTCGEHAVLGNPLYLLGTSLARYRIWDGIRGLDYLASLPEVDAQRMGCAGNSGGGTLTAYIAALDPRVKAAAIGCYITTLPRRMANRIEADPDSDPEQDIFGMVGEGIDHAGLLALRVPRPTLLATARFDFFPIEGARESFAEAKKLYEVAGAGDAIDRVEAAPKHGLSLTLRQGMYGFFERWLAGKKVEGEVKEIAVTPRPAKDLRVTPDGQINFAFKSWPLLSMVLWDFDGKKTGDWSLRDVLRLDPEHADYRVTEVAAGAKANRTLVVLVNGNESRGWQEGKDFLKALEQAGYELVVVDPRGVGALRPDLTVRGHAYADPLCGVEANLAYNAFLVGKSLLGMRVTDVQAAVKKVAVKNKLPRVVLVGRRDAALVACMTAAIEPGVECVAVEEMPLSYRRYFEAVGRPINAASVLPGMLSDYGDIGNVLAEMAPRRVLVAAGLGKSTRDAVSVQVGDTPFTQSPKILVDWLSKGE